VPWYKPTEDMLSAVDAGSVTAVAGLDHSAAFDTISHTKFCGIFSNFS